MKYSLLFIFILFSCKKKENKTVKIQRDTIRDIKSQNYIIKKEKFDILKILLDEEISNEKPKKVDYKSYSVSFDNEGDSYSVSLKKIASEDFNKDGIEDYIVERNSEGMLGGNANTNSEILYIIMRKDSNIQDKHRILTYAPFSYNILDNITYKNGILKAIATQNYRTYSKLVEELESTNLSFIYKTKMFTKRPICQIVNFQNGKIRKYLKTRQNHSEQLICIIILKF